jgi:transposase InsO family protein
VYLTIVMDLADRQIIGWSLSESMDAAETTVAAWKAACTRRPPQRGLLFHSDQGAQYGCSDFTRQLKKAQVTQSMSRKGNCWDNAPAESFFKTLKAELRMDLHSCNYRQVRQIIFRFIEVWYNRKRLHSALNYKTPATAENQLKQQAA